MDGVEQSPIYFPACWLAGRVGVLRVRACAEPASRVDVLRAPGPDASGLKDLIGAVARVHRLVAIIIELEDTVQLGRVLGCITVLGNAAHKRRRDGGSYQR